MTKGYDELFLYALKVVQEAEADQLKNPTSDFIKVLIVEPFKKPYVKTIKNELEAMQDIVGGNIEPVTIGSTPTGARVMAVVNEEGKILNLPYNRKILSSKGTIDVFAGTFFISAVNFMGDHISLTDEMIQRYMKRFAGIEVYL